MTEVQTPPAVEAGGTPQNLPDKDDPEQKVRDFPEGGEKLDPKHLDEPTAQKITHWSRDWFEQVYEKWDPEEIPDNFSVIKFVEREIAELSGESEAFASRMITPTLREGSALFLDELIEFTKEKALGGEDDRLNNFVRSIQEALFSAHPSVATNLGLSQMIEFTTKANRVPEVQGWFGGTMVGEMVYKLSFTDEESVQFAADSVLEHPLEDQLDITHQLQTVGADAIASGGWAESALYNTRWILGEIAAENKSPIVGYATELTLDRLEEEEESPTLGVAKYPGDPSESRLPETLKEELEDQHLRLSRQINPDVEIGRGGRILPVATDAVGIYDHSNLLRQLGRVELTSLPEPSSISIVALRNALKAIKDEKNNYPSPLTQVVSFINERILVPEKGVSQNDFAALGTEWSKISSVLSKEQWKDYLTLISETEDLRIADQRLIPTASYLGKNYEQLSGDTQRYLEKVKEGLVQELVPVTFQSYEKIPQNGELNPFAKTEDEGLPLLLQHLHQPALREKIEEDLGISLTQIPLRSQIHLLRFLAGQDQEGFDRVRGVLRDRPNIGNKILSSFLATAEDVHYGDVVLQLAESLDEKTAEAVFTKYLGIATEAEKVRLNLLDNFHKEGKEDQINEVAKGLLKKGNEFLSHLLPQVKETGEHINTAKVLEELENIRSDIIVFAATFKAASAEYPLSFNKIEDTSLRSKDSAELSASEKEEMLRLFKQNRTDYPPKLFEVVLGEFNEAISTQGKRFYLLTHRGVLTGFIRFDELENGNLYAASLNVRPEVRGLSIGSACLQATLEQEGEGRSVEAVAYLKNPMLRNYIERFGFIATGVDPDYKGSGEGFLILRRDEKERGRLKGPTMSKEEILLAAIKKREEENIEVGVYNPKNEQELVDEIGKHVSAGQILSRFYVSSEDTAYLVFEAAPARVVA